MVYALQTLSDKPYMGSVTSGPNAADTIRMSEILFGGREAIEKTTASVSLINVNSPLRFDDRMLAALHDQWPGFRFALALKSEPPCGTLVPQHGSYGR